MNRQEYFELHKKEQKRLYQVLDEKSEAMKRFPKGEMGLTPDEVKESLEFKTARKAYQNAFNDVINFNTMFLREFKKELRDERNNRKA
jgi:hypothetical protein